MDQDRSNRNPVSAISYLQKLYWTINGYSGVNSIQRKFPLFSQVHALACTKIRQKTWHIVSNCILSRLWDFLLFACCNARSPLYEYWTYRGIQVVRISSYLCDPFLPCNAPRLQVDILYYMVEYSYFGCVNDTAPSFKEIDWRLSRTRKPFIDSSHYDRGKGISADWNLWLTLEGKHTFTQHKDYIFSPSCRDGD